MRNRTFTWTRFTNQGIYLIFQKVYVNILKNQIFLCSSFTHSFLSIKVYFSVSKVNRFKLNWFNFFYFLSILNLFLKSFLSFHKIVKLLNCNSSFSNVFKNRRNLADWRSTNNKTEKCTKNNSRISVLVDDEPLWKPKS